MSAAANGTAFNAEIAENAEKGRGQGTRGERAKKKRRPDGTPLRFCFTCCGPLTDGVFDYLRLRRRSAAMPPTASNAIVAGSGRLTFSTPVPLKYVSLK